MVVWWRTNGRGVAVANYFRGQFGPPGTGIVAIKTKHGAVFKVHREAGPYFLAFLNELERIGYKIDPKQSGGYSFRRKIGGRGLSQHAYGNAIDINWNHNRWMSRKHDFPKDIAAIASRFGLEWGGTWRHTPDPMHFEYTGKKVKLA